MNTKLSKMLRSGLSMFLVICMISSVIPFAVFAIEEPEETKTLNYVSLGDSMTNGYGLTGYNGNSGVADYGYGSYTNQFADWLVDTGYADEVNHTQLALSAMRAEDLHWLLEVDYEDEEVLALIDEMDKNYATKWNVINQAIADEKYTQEYVDALDSSKEAYFEAYEDEWNEVFSNGDSWTWRELVHDYRFNVIANYVTYFANGGTDDNIDLKNEWTGYKNYSDVEALQIVAEYYQDAVANADIVSNGIGNGNFGVFMLGRIQEAIGFSGNPTQAMIYKVENAIRECSPEVQAKILELKDTLYAELADYINMEDDMMAALVNSIVYGELSYVLNWCGATDAIVKLNPDVELMIVGLMNTMNGIKMEIGGVTIDVGELMGIMLDSLNAFMAAYPVVMQAQGHFADATFYYAEAGQIECYADTYNDTIYTEGVVRQRFVSSIVGEEKYKDQENKWGLIWQSLKPVASSMGTAIQFITLADIQEYEALGDADKIEYAKNDRDKAMSIAFYLAAEKAVLRVLAEGGTMSGDAAVALGNGTLAFDSVVTLFEKKLGEYTPAATERVNAALKTTDGYNITFLVALFAMPDALGDALAEDEAVGGLLNLWAHCLLGNGLSGHPSQGGHDQLAEAVVAAYENKHTCLDETLGNVWYLISNYYDEAYAYGYAYAVEAGYIAKANEAVDAAIAQLLAIEITEATVEFRAEAETAIAQIVATLESVKNLLNNADELDEETLAYAQAMLAEADAMAKALVNVIEQATNDVVDLAVIPAINEAVKYVSEVVIPAATEASKVIAEKAVENFKAKAEEIADELVNEMCDAAQKYAPVVADAIYDYLYNNPEQVIEFVKYVAPYASQLLDEYGDEVLMVLAYIGYNYGEDIVKIIVDNHEVILETILTWVDVHGWNAILLVEVYAEALGLCDTVREQIAVLEQLAEQLEAELKYQAAYIEAQIEELKAQLETASEAVKAEIEAQIEELEAELEAAKTEIEAQIEELKAQLETATEAVKAEIKAQIAELEAQLEAVKAELESQIAELKAQLETATEAVKAEIEAQIEELEAELDAVKNEIKAQIEELKDTASELNEQLADAVAKALADVENLKDVAEELKAQAEAIIAAVKDLDEADLDELLGKIDLNTEAIENLVNELVDTVNEVIYKATHANYNINSDSSYVALGNSSVYTEALADYLKTLVNEADTHYAYNSTDLTVEGSDITEIADVIAANLGAVASADLITLGYSNNVVATESLNIAIDLLVKGNTNYDTEYAWNELFGDFVAAQIEKMIVEFSESLDEKGLNVTLNELIGAQFTASTVTATEALCVAFENYIYNVTSYAVYLPMVVEQIVEINPDALIVIVGMSNPFEGLAIELGEMDVDVSVINYIIGATDVESLVYAVLSDNVIFVPANEAETNASDLVWLTDYMNGELNIEYTENGNAYIMEQILNALIITVEENGLWGDADGNGIVNTADANLVLQYYTESIDETALNLEVCDVNGDGVVNTADANLILQYYTEAIEVFPVEE